PPVFTRTGLVVIVNERDRAGLEANVAMQRELGIDVRLVSAQVLADIDANSRLGEEELAVYEAEAGYVEAVQVVASFAAGGPTAGGGSRSRAWCPKATAWSASRPTRAATSAGRWSWRPARGRRSWPGRRSGNCRSRLAAPRWPCSGGRRTSAGGARSMPI